MQSIQSRLAKALQLEFFSNGGDAAWFWIDGGGFGAPAKSYLGVTTQLMTCESHNESEFKKTLEKEWQQEKTDHNLDPYASGFNGGWLLALAYEFGSNRDSSVLDSFRHNESDRSDTNREQSTGIAMHVPAVIEIDHKTGKAKVLKSDNKHLTNMLASKLENLLLQTNFDSNTLSTLNIQTSKTLFKGLNNPNNLIIPESEYVEAVEAAKRIINSGELSVLCLTNRVELPIDEYVDPLPIFLALQESSNAPRAGIIEWSQFGDGVINWLVSASPERFVSKTGDKVNCAPIKGTRKRGKTVEDDSKLKQELLTSTKELTENSRVLTEVQRELENICKSGSIYVTSEGHVESYKQVHQLVSEIEGTLEAEIGFWEVIDELFAPASMTGVPKQKAIQTAASLERENRGWYSGCFGTVSPGATDVELAVTIRSLECDSTKIRIGAGGGIIESSDAEFEWQEVLLKSHAMLNALQNDM